NISLLINRNFRPCNITDPWLNCGSNICMMESPMKYTRAEAKSHSRATMRGLWAAANVPFREDGSIDEEGYRRNLEHWITDLGIDGFFVAGKQGEFFSMSLDERKRMFDLSVDAVAGRAQTIMSCSDQNMDVVIELARHAQACGA